MPVSDALLREIRTLPQGRTLDGLVAEQIMKLSGSNLPGFSTDIAAAWLVVEKMVRTEGVYFGAPHYKNKRQSLAQLGYPEGTECWYCVINTKVLNKVVVCADTAPLAICRAAVLWARSNQAEGMLSRSSPPTERSTSGDAAQNRELFNKALQKESIPCGRSDCEGPVEVQDVSHLHDRLKTFSVQCKRCGWEESVTGREELSPSWDDTSLLDMAYDHSMHKPATCPYDGTMIVFASMPNPRRKARYRLSCYFCGRQAEMDWPPQELRR